MRKWRGNPWAVLLVLSLGFFMTLLDLTIVNIAIPSMIDKLHASLDEVLWVVNAYIIVLAVLLITAGRLGDLRGTRNIFIVGVVLFTAASAVCGLSANPTQLITFRAIQGLGAALLIPQTLTIITTIFPPERRGAALGIWGAVAGVATIAGPTLGGLLVTAFDWRSIFFVNLPFGVAVLILSFIIIPDTRPGRKQPLDIPGVAVASAALLCITYGLIEGQRYNWGKITSFISIPLLLAVGIVLLAAFFLLQARRQDRQPLIPFGLFRDRNYALMNAVSATVSVGMLGIFLPLSIYLQSVDSMSALKAGLTLAPASIVSMFVAPVAGHMSDRIGGKYILMAGLALFAGGMAWVIAVAGVGTPWYHFLPGLAVSGFGIGCTFAPMLTVAMRNVEPRLAGAASGVFNTTRQLGSVVGTATIGALLQNQLATALVTEAGKHSAEVPPRARAQFVAGFQGAAKRGLEVGAGQSGGNVKLPPGIVPAQVAKQISAVAREVFTQAYVMAMRPTMALPICVVLLGALTCLGIKRRKGVTDTTPTGTPTGAPVQDRTGVSPSGHAQGTSS